MFRVLQATVADKTFKRALTMLAGAQTATESAFIATAWSMSNPRTRILINTRELRRTRLFDNYSIHFVLLPWALRIAVVAWQLSGSWWSRITTGLHPMYPWENKSDKRYIDFENCMCRSLSVGWRNLLFVLLWGRLLLEGIFCIAQQRIKRTRNRNWIGIRLYWNRQSTIPQASGKNIEEDSFLTRRYIPIHIYYSKSP